MKIAVVTDDQTTISQHFGRAYFYAVFTVEDGKIAGREMRPKLGHDQFQHEQHDRGHDHDHDHGHGYGEHSQDKHSRMMANIRDCQVLLAGGMGMGARASLQAIGIKPILTSLREIDAAVAAFLAGELRDQPKLLH